MPTGTEGYRKAEVTLGGVDTRDLSSRTMESVQPGLPRVLLTTFPQEPHGLGILMAEANFALESCHCVSLGVQTPVWDIALAAGAQRADIVALSFSAAVNANQALDGLLDLRGRLPPTVEVWAGGGCPALHRRPPTGVLALRTLDEIAPAVQRWRGVARGAAGEMPDNPPSL